MFGLDPGTSTAIVFLLLGLILVVLEVFNPGFFIAVPGGTLFIMGSIGLIAPELMFGSSIAWAMWPAAAIIATLANLYLYKKWAPAGEKPDTMTNDSLPGEEGRVTVDVVPHKITGKVLIRGSTWSARAAEDAKPIPVGTRVRVIRAEGVHVVVEPLWGLAMPPGPLSEPALQPPAKTPWPRPLKQMAGYVAIMVLTGGLGILLFGIPAHRAYREARAVYDSRPETPGKWFLDRGYPVVGAILIVAITSALILL